MRTKNRFPILRTLHQFSLLGLAMVFSGANVIQGQVCDEAGQQTLSAGSPQVTLDNFCNGAVDGTNCPDASISDVAPVQLQLSGGEQVNLTCTVVGEGPSLCILGADCTAAENPNLSSVTLNSPVSGTEHTLLVVDNGDVTICSEGVTVECNGDWGSDDDGGGEPPPPPSNKLLVDNFESQCFDRWDQRKNVPNCTTASASLLRGQSNAHPVDGYQSFAAGLHTATIAARPGTELQLHLWRWQNSTWERVASADGRSFPSTIEFRGEPGLYFWQVVSDSPASRYRLRFEHPGTVESQGSSGNRLAISQTWSHDGIRSLESVYTPSRKKSFLIHKPDRESSYRASFYLWPQNDFTMMKEERHTVLLGRDGKAKGPVLFKVIVEGHRSAKKFRLRLLQKIEGEFVEVSKSVLIKRRKKARVVVEWQAASPGAADGFLCLGRGKTCKPSRRAESSEARSLRRIEFGQVERDDRSTTGSLFIDVFNSERLGR